MVDPGIKEKIEIPEEVEVEFEGKTIKVSGPEGELSRRFDLRQIKLWKEDDKIVIESKSARKKRRSAVGTVISHIKNMFQGVIDPYTGKLKVCYSHFPVKVNVEGKYVKIENFIGEEEPRLAEIVGDTEVNIDEEEIEVTGPDKEAVGQTAANIEQTAQVKNKDPRVFQDGIYITERP